MTIVKLRAEQQEIVIPRDGLGRPMIYPRSGGVPVAHARSSSFAEVIDDKTALYDYKGNIIVSGLARKESLLASVKASDPDMNRTPNRNDPDFRAVCAEVAERAQVMGGRDVKSDAGTLRHLLSEFVDRNRPMPDTVTEAEALDMAAYLLLVDELGLEFSAIETFVVNTTYQTAGTFDRLGYCPIPDPAGEVGNKIIDLKTGAVDFGGLKMACQLCIYAGGELYDPSMLGPAPSYAPHVKKKDDPEAFEAWKAWREWKETELEPGAAELLYGPLPEVSQKWGLILNVPTGTGEGYAYWADLELGRKAAQLSLEIREIRKDGRNALVAFSG